MPHDAPPDKAGEDSSRASASFPATIFNGSRSLLARLRKPRHFWEITFAILLAIYFAYYWAGYDRPQYKLYILIGDDIPNTAGVDVRNRLKKPAEGLRLKDTAVETQIIDIPVGGSQAAIATALSVFNRQDALLIVGIFDSKPTEDLLPNYMHMRPQIPFIAAVQSNNDLLRLCDVQCFDSDKPVPLLQLSPTNADQAKWAIKFATERKMHSFLIVSDDHSSNTSYVDGLAKAFDKEITSTDIHLGATVSDVAGALSRNRPACILYAGDPGNAQVLLADIALMVQAHSKDAVPWSPTVLLSDTAVPPTLTSVTYKRVVNLTDENDAEYYSHPGNPNAYGLDAVTIAVQLIRELEDRGFDWRVSLKSALLNRSNAEDIRRNLVRIMQEDFRFHSSYLGDDDTGPISGLKTVYTFDCPAVAANGHIEPKTDGTANYCQRYAGFFHVWEWDPNKKAMSDIDTWHPKRSSAQ